MLRKSGDESLSNIKRQNTNRPAAGKIIIEKKNNCKEIIIQQILKSNIFPFLSGNCNSKSCNSHCLILEICDKTTKQ